MSRVCSFGTQLSSGFACLAAKTNPLLVGPAPPSEAHVRGDAGYQAGGWT